MRALAVVGVLGLGLGLGPSGRAERAREVLPTPAALPTPDAEGDLAIDDFTLHHAEYGQGAAVVLLHGGLGSGEQFGDQVPALAAAHRVILVDSRGQGRSTRSAHGTSYHLMAEDVIALLDHLAIDRAAIVGWSDGGVIGLDLAIHHPERLTALFVLGTNATRAGTQRAGGRARFAAYWKRAIATYRAIAPRPDDLAATRADLRAMWRTEPAYTTAELAAIATPTVVALGEHDEIIKRSHAEAMARTIPGARLVVIAGASHFALWQDPDAVNQAVLAVLDP